MEIVNRWRNDDIPQAMAEFESAVKLDPTFARAHARLGLMYLRTWWQTQAPNAMEPANKETELAVRLDGADSRCLSIRGWFLLATNDFDAAFDHFEHSLQLSPDDPELIVNMAYYLIFTGQADKAIERLPKALRANPLFAPPSYREAIGLAFMMAKRYEEAVKSFAAVSSPDTYVPVWAAGCLVKLGRLEEARTQSRLASKLDPDWPTRDWRSEFKYIEDQEHVGELVDLAINALRDCH